MIASYSILEIPLIYPEPSTRFLIEQETHCGFEIVGLAETKEEAEQLYDRLSSNREAEYV